MKRALSLGIFLILPVWIPVFVLGFLAKFIKTAFEVGYEYAGDLGEWCFKQWDIKP